MVFTVVTITVETTLPKGWVFRQRPKLLRNIIWECQLKTDREEIFYEKIYVQPAR